MILIKHVYRVMCILITFKARLHKDRLLVLSLIPLQFHKHHTNHDCPAFPKVILVNKRNHFCSSWYVSYPWLNYQDSDSVLCFHCHVAERRHLPVSLNKDDAFIKEGYTNWKKAIERFDKHDKCKSHHQCVQLVEKIPRTTKNVGDLLSTEYDEQKAENREMLKNILSSIHFLGRQGLAIHGRFKTSDEGDSGELDSNFVQLLKTRAEDNQKLFSWMKKIQI